jgi:hypothetical protein
LTHASDTFKDRKFRQGRFKLKNLSLVLIFAASVFLFVDLSQDDQIERFLLIRRLFSLCSS